MTTSKDEEECKRCNRMLQHYQFPPRRRVCRTCYTKQVAECHARAGYKPPASSLLQIRAWRVLNQLRSDTELFRQCANLPETKLSVTARQVSTIISKTRGKGVALLPRSFFDFRLANMRLVSLDDRRKLLQIITSSEDAPRAYADALVDIVEEFEIFHE